MKIKKTSNYRKVYRWNLFSKAPQEYIQKSKQLGLSFLEAQVLYSRGKVTDFDLESFLNPNYSTDPENLQQTEDLKDLSIAVERILQAIEKKETMGIYGDYDADGLSSSALLYQFFEVYRYFCKKEVSIQVFFPDRLSEGYGLKKSAIDSIESKGVKLIITVDNGMSSHSAIEYANQKNIDVIIVDHHRVGGNPMPKALAIVNPKQSFCMYPFKDFSAVGLVYKLTERLCEKLFTPKQKEQFLKRYSDYVAIGTYQDMAPLRGENLHLVRQGIANLDAMRRGECSTNLRGLLELLKALQLDKRRISSWTLGFGIGPVLNSAGRIGDTKMAWELLVTRDRARAELLAKELKLLNDQRKKLTQVFFKQALEIVQEKELHKRPLIVLYSEHWHSGIIGLIAQRVAQEFWKSTIVMTSYQLEHYVASARSFGNLNIGQLIEDLKDHFLYCGGHSRAGGFSMEKNRLADFEKDLWKKLSYSPSYPEIQSNTEHHEEVRSMDLNIEACISLKDCSENLYPQLLHLEPFGEENPQPVLGILDLNLLSLRSSKRGKDTLIRVSQNSEYTRNWVRDFVFFGQTEYLENFQKGQKVDLAVSVSEGEIKAVDMRLTEHRTKDASGFQ